MPVSTLSGLDTITRNLHLESSHIQSDIIDANVQLPDAAPQSLKDKVAAYKAKLEGIQSNISNDETVLVLQDKLNELITAVNQQELDIAQLKSQVASFSGFGSLLSNLQSQVTAVQKDATDAKTQATQKTDAPAITTVDTTKQSLKAVTSSVVVGNKSVSVTTNTSAVKK